MKTLRQFRNIIRRGLTSVWRNLGMAVTSVVSVTLVLLMLGLVLLMVFNVEQVVFGSGVKLQRIVVFFENNTPQDKLTEVEKKSETMESVDKVELTSKKKALNEMKDRLGDDDYILEGLPESPLPISFILHSKSLNDGKRVAWGAKMIPGVCGVQYYNELVSNMLRAYRGVRHGGTAAIRILLLTTIVLIYNTIRITLQSRWREIQTMRYVRANNYCIRGPLLIERLLSGLLVGVLACIILCLLCQYNLNRFNSQSLDTLGVDLFIPDRRLSMNLLVILASLGMGTDYLRSIIPATRHLDV